MIATAILSGIIGLLIGLAICYFRQIKTVVQNKDKISTGADLISAGGKFLESLGVKF